MQRKQNWKAHCMQFLEKQFEAETVLNASDVGFIAEAEWIYLSPRPWQTSLPINYLSVSLLVSPLQI